ncbi:UDP-3-O-(3-hydroxymyristoyl)glucosamine N-acyltransferase [Alphaproteobacteria bacterium]|nr:UDP-3-O-(3-hydroxymyristoyl)glucosamine N-acyltransferase [Alphaproteobacteria bacterium]
MADPRFYDCAGPFSASAIAALIDGTCTGDDASIFKDIASLETAQSDMLSFFSNPKLSQSLSDTKAGAVLMSQAHRELCPPHVQAIICVDPYRAMAHVARAFYPLAAQGRPMAGERQDGHLVHPSAHIGDNVVLGLGAMIGPNVVIGDDCVIGAGAIIGHGVTLGHECVIGPQVTLGFCLLGNRVMVQSGARLGTDGFGFAPGQSHIKIPQLGRLIVQDDVEIGANCTLDRGAMGDTTIGEGTKLDNLVHIAHNVELGRHCFLAAESGIAGSTKIGDYVQMGGQSGISGHLEIGSHSLIGGKSFVAKSLPEKASVSGAPARPRGELYRDQAFVSRLRKAAEKNKKD